MLKISNTVSLADWEIQMTAIRSAGNGGQNVNKVATAIHLRFDIAHSTLPDVYKQRLLASNDSRLSKDGVLVIKAQSFRTQEQNREDAQKRLVEFIQAAMVVQKTRRPTRPTRASKIRRVDNKKKRSEKKSLRGKLNM
ncbi:alternative ribosome rescue aminoacyl-tRNA hydrolase ArfB [Vibrio zhugei]|uniref:Alternative ribosome rescue aminoacyl-tRNA hydrolase ArfB n=1 Tax=Vibrio zhugei TaxID=2479546 RepID=A0ABV7CBD8_9VIBR|nr:alternative ribosome rescue aminoacyl-tRNA hydrolase ArfB [Vibrio zhugei]